jgi:CubicO group peptidase (beta-lactamase class C family)
MFSNEDWGTPDMTQETRQHNDRFLRRKRREFATTLLFAACLSAVSRAPAQAGKLSEERRTKMETEIATFMAASKVPGLSVAIVQDGEVVWSAGFGMADLENSVPATSQTVYRVGSISKPLTATAALALWEQGKLNLDSPVQSYCPAFPQKQWPITTRQLLSHLGGIRYYKVPEYPYTESQSDPEVGNTRHFDNGIEGGMRFFASDPLVAQPGNCECARIRAQLARIHYIDSDCGRAGDQSGGDDCSEVRGASKCSSEESTIPLHL